MTTALIIVICALAIAPGIVGLVVFARAYERRSETERETNALIARLAAWNVRADAWEQWANATGGEIPQSFLDELTVIVSRPRPGQ